MKKHNYKLLFCLCLFLLHKPLLYSQSNQLEESKKILAGSSNDSLLAIAIVNIGDEISRNKPKELLNYAIPLKQKGEKENSRVLLENTYHQIALAYSNLRMYDSANKYFRKAVSINIGSKDKVLTGVIKHDIGYFYYQQNIYDSSLIYYHQSLEVKKQVGKEKPIATTLNNIGLVYRMRNNYTVANEYYSEALKIYDKLKDKASLSVMSNMATLFNLQKKYDSATVLYKKVYEFASNNKDINMMFTAQVNIALGLNFQEKYAEALPVFLELSQNPRVKQIEDINNAVQYGLGQCYVGIKDYTKAIPILQNCLTLRFKNTKYQSLAAINNLLYIAEEAQGNFKQALEYYKRIKVYSDSLLNINKDLVIEELNTKYKTAQKEQQINLLNKENELKDLKLKENNTQLLLAAEKAIKRQQEIELLNQSNVLQALTLKEKQQSLLLSESKVRQGNQQVQILNKDNLLKDLTIKDNKRTRWLYIAGIMLTGLLAAGIFYLYRNKQKTNLQLEVKNTIISTALSEKEILLREIHHRVKNNLQVISSLLNLQSRSISDEKALEAIKEGRDRVRSMALIHQNLYQDKDLTGVDVKDYIEKLTQSLFNSYNIQPGKVLLYTDIDPIKLDVDTVIPLGLILNELISNSLKYAFDEKPTDGKVEVMLKEADNKLLLQVRDNGKGLPEDWNIERLHSMGFQLVKSFTTKLKAELSIDGSNGTNVQMNIGKYKLLKSL